MSYPPNEAALVWQVASSDSGSARVRISYLLGNLNKSFAYRAVASNDEKTLTLSEYIRIQNLANESFGSTGLWAGFGPRFLKPIGINETKEMLIEKYQQVPVKKTYTADPQHYGYLDRPQNKLLIPMHYVLKNDKASQLGRAPLQYGKVRIFQEDSHGGTAFLGEDWGKFTPMDDEMRLSVGTAQDVVVMGFEGFVRVFNNSGEEYENAQVRLVVGKINLVEKIAQLAQLPPRRAGVEWNKVAAEDKLLEMDESADAVNGLMGGMGGGGGRGGAVNRPKQIIKEGLSEYFIYTIEGTETIPNGWSKRMRSFEGQTVPFKIQYRYRAPEYGDQLVRMYLLTNNKESKLGTTPLPDGVVRVFRQNGRDGLSFLVAQQIKYIPIGDKIELNLGPDPEVIFQLVKLRVWRDDIWRRSRGRTCSSGWMSRACRSRSTAPSSAGMTTRFMPSGFGTIPGSRSEWRFGVPFPATSFYVVASLPRTTTTRRFSTWPT